MHAKFFKHNYELISFKQTLKNSYLSKYRKIKQSSRVNLLNKAITTHINAAVVFKPYSNRGNYQVINICSNPISGLLTDPDIRLDVKSVIINYETFMETCVIIVP